MISKSLRCSTGLSLGLVLFLAVSALGQLDEPPTKQQLLAHRLMDMSRIVLASRGEPSEPQINMATVLLKQASQLDSKNAEIASLYIEALQMTDQKGELAKALASYVRLRPRDDVAQLKLIRLLAENKQTADARLEFYRKFFKGKMAQKFSPALRSRMALDAALLQRELGKQDKFVDLLKLSLNLDTTHKQAADKAYNELVTHQAPAQDVASALFTLLMTDPTDAQTHAMIADLLFNCGQYTKAIVWYESSNAISIAAGQQMSDEMIAHSLLCYWGIGKATDALGYIDMIDQSNQPLPPEPEIDPATGQPVEETEKVEVERVPLPLELHILKLALLNALEQNEAISEPYIAVVRRFEESIKQSPDDPGPLRNLIWVNLVLNQNIEKTAQLIQTLTPKLSEQGKAELPVIEGWLAYRQDNKDKAIKLLEPLAKTNARAAFGLSFLYQGKTRQAELLKQAYALAPTDVFGLLAVDQLRRNKSKFNELAKYHKIGQVFDSVPDDLLEMINKPSDFVLMRLEMPKYRYAYGSPVFLKINLQNVSQIPIGLGPDSTIPTRVLLAPSAKMGGLRRPQIPPLVADLHRRLRLAPDETVSMTVQLDSGSLGALLAQSPMQSVYFNMLVLTNPRITRNGQYAAGPMGTGAKVHNIKRGGWPLAADTPERLEKQLGQITGPDVFRAMQAIEATIAYINLLQRSDDEQSQEIYKTMATALEKSYSKIPNDQKAWMITCLPPSKVFHERFKSMLDKAAGSDSDLVRLALLTRHINAPDSPWLNESLRSGSPTTKQYAKWVQQWAQQIKDLQEKLKKEKQDSGRFEYDK